jgi:hypothetical protein
MDNLYPEEPDLNDMVPRVLTEPHLGKKGHRSVAEEWGRAIAMLGARERRYLGVFWLAHVGRLIDSESRVRFDLTKQEAAAYMRVATGNDDHEPDLAEGTVEPLLEDGLLRFNQIRRCRQADTEKQAHRLQRGILDPVTAD